MIATADLYSASATSGLRGRRQEQLGLASVWCGTQWWSSDARSGEAILVPGAGPVQGRYKTVAVVKFDQVDHCTKALMEPHSQKVLTNLSKSARPKRGDGLLIL
jgi:hypothetical protein